MDSTRTQTQISTLAVALKLWPGMVGLPALRSIDFYMYSHIRWRGPVVELGGGDGRFANLLSLPSPVIVDYARKPIVKGLAEFSNAVGVQASLENLPLRCESVADAICNSTLEHVADIDRALSEVRRVLRSDGRVFITVPDRSYVESLHFGPPSWPGYARYFDQLWHHVHRLDANEWRSKLSSAGLRISHERSYLPPSAVDLIDRLFQVNWSSAPFVPPERDLLVADTATSLIAPWLSRELNHALTDLGRGAFLFFECQRDA